MKYTKSPVVSVSALAGMTAHLLQSQVEEAIEAAEHTSAVKVFSPEEIAAYELQLKGGE